MIQQWHFFQCLDLEVFLHLISDVINILLLIDSNRNGSQVGNYPWKWVSFIWSINRVKNHRMQRILWYVLLMLQLGLWSCQDLKHNVLTLQSKINKYKFIHFKNNLRSIERSLNLKIYCFDLLQCNYLKERWLNTLQKSNTNQQPATSQPLNDQHIIT